MCAKYELTFHYELKMINCFCGFMCLSHHCTVKIKGTISIVRCIEGWVLCEKEKDKKEYIAQRWEKNDNGYDVCGSCSDKLGGPICEDCFCKYCYSSLDDKCKHVVF